MNIYIVTIINTFTENPCEYSVKVFINKKEAINYYKEKAESFILDVAKNETPMTQYYLLEDDEYKIRHYMDYEGNEIIFECKHEKIEE